jgi:hypothetical protein
MKGSEMAFKAEIIDGELHLVISLGVTCKLCGKTYPEELLRGEITEKAFTQHERNVSDFVGVPYNPTKPWGYVYNKEMDESFLVCSDCYAPIFKLDQDMAADRGKMHQKLAAQCLERRLWDF